jgi:hypothetical protein
MEAFEMIEALGNVEVAVAHNTAGTKLQNYFGIIST